MAHGRVRPGGGDDDDSRDDEPSGRAPGHGQEGVEGRRPHPAEGAAQLCRALVLPAATRVHHLGLERPAGRGQVQLGPGDGHVTQPHQGDRDPADGLAGEEGDQGFARDQLIAQLTSPGKRRCIDRRWCRRGRARPLRRPTAGQSVSGRVPNKGVYAPSTEATRSGGAPFSCSRRCRPGRPRGDDSRGCSAVWLPLRRR